MASDNLAVPASTTFPQPKPDPHFDTSLHLALARAELKRDERAIPVLRRIISHERMRAQLVIGVMILAFSSLCWGDANQQCSAWDVTFGPFVYGNEGFQEHATGGHSWQLDFTGQCGYVLDSSGGLEWCDTIAETGGSVFAGEQGQLSQGYIFTHHTPGVNIEGGIATGANAPASAGLTGADAVLDCVLTCDANVGLSYSQSGIGISVSYPPKAIYKQAHQYTLNCAAEQPNPIGPGGPSPILIDTIGGGFHLSDPKNAAVLFDIDGDGKPIEISWPVAGSGNAWLVYDPGKKQTITNGKQLFGNHTPQPHHPNKTPNGFLALAEYDANKDLVIDSRDPAWSDLYLWIDTHCYQDPKTPCTSLPAELHRPEEFGITSFGLVYEGDNKRDQWGNWFRFWAFVNIDTSRSDRQHTRDAAERRMYDVWLAK